MKRISIAAVAALTLFGLTACGKSVDVEQTGAQNVPGVNNLFRFCDGPTLIYFSKWSGQSDEYEWFYPGGCMLDEQNKRWIFNDTPPQYSLPNGDSTETDDK